MTTLSPITLPMPRLGETMERGTIANWMVEPGSDFKRGDPLLELESDKTLVEYPALGSGRLLETLVGPGDVVEVGAPIAVIGTEDAWEGVAPERADPARVPAAAPAPEPASVQHQVPQRDTSTAIRATPLARRLARRANVDLSLLAGSGRRGRIEARDVEAHASRGGARLAPAVGGRHGPATDLPVFFIHGLAGLGSNWEVVRASLQKGGLETSAPDLPGHGRNATEASGVDDLIEWLGQSLSGLPAPVHLVGHSLGAHVAAMAARRETGRVGRITLVAPVGCGHDINGTFVQAIAAARSAGELRHLLRLLGPKASQLPDDAVRSMAQELAGGRLGALAGSMARGDTQCIDTISVAAELADIMPVTAIFGTADRIVSKEHVFNMPPRVASHMIRTGHMPHWDAPGLLERLITQSA